ncbi:hypothetical protein BD310DRAFT_916252 [Dichomitus squalens]|uniref:Uncharacterized protein n=1 Tax=Dichomitus squalens TaxID=114155 RepID=A0A4Q9Q7K5_9APHY|nr:hypothetical protein BD310DRAFT_916252 [Dichomitus squalens]
MVRLRARRERRRLRPRRKRRRISSRAKHRRARARTSRPPPRHPQISRAHRSHRRRLGSARGPRLDLQCRRARRRVGRLLPRHLPPSLPLLLRTMPGPPCVAHAQFLASPRDSSRLRLAGRASSASRVANATKTRTRTRMVPRHRRPAPQLLQKLLLRPRRRKKNASVVPVVVGSRLGSCSAMRPRQRYWPVLLRDRQRARA